MGKEVNKNTTNPLTNPHTHALSTTSNPRQPTSQPAIHCLLTPMSCNPISPNVTPAAIYPCSKQASSIAVGHQSPQMTDFSVEILNHSYTHAWTHACMQAAAVTATATSAIGFFPMLTCPNVHPSFPADRPAARERGKTPRERYTTHMHTHADTQGK